MTSVVKIKNVVEMKNNSGREEDEFSYTLQHKGKSISEQELSYKLMKQKKDFMKHILSVNVEGIKQGVKKNNGSVSLYYGTTTAQLSSILLDGILPRKDTHLGNGSNESMEPVIYMTNKWHYFDAFNKNRSYINEQCEKDRFACYIECRVPKDLLVIDENFITTDYMKRKVQTCLKKDKVIIFDAMECLAEYGTVGVLGGISPSMIVSFTVLVAPKMENYIVNPDSPYNKEYYEWSEGKGKGKIKLRQLLEKEATSPLNGTWWINQLRLRNKSFLSNPSFGINQNTGKIAIYLKEKANH